MTDTETPRILSGDHRLMTDAQKRHHYQQGCRHQDCRAARAAYAKAYAARKARRPEPAPSPRPEPAPARRPKPTLPPRPAPAEDPDPPTPKPTPLPPAAMAVRGAQRRLQALVDFGYGPKELASATGITVDSIWRLLVAPPEQIKTSTHVRVDEVFRALRVTPKFLLKNVTRDRDAQNAFAIAHHFAWAGPYDWDNIDTDEKPTVRPPARRTLGDDTVYDVDLLRDLIRTTQLEQQEPKLVPASLVDELNLIIVDRDQKIRELEHELDEEQREFDRAWFDLKATIADTTHSHGATVQDHR